METLLIPFVIGFILNLVIPIESLVNQKKDPYKPNDAVTKWIDIIFGTIGWTIIV